MKAGIHPKYFDQATIACACGAKYVTGSSQERIDIELCAACHPFFTGKQKIIDSARRVEKFSGRAEQKGTSKVLSAKDKKAKEAARIAKRVEKKAAGK